MRRFVPLAVLALLLCGLTYAADPKPDLIDSPIPPGHGPRHPSPIDCDGEVCSPGPRNAPEALVAFSGLNGQGMGYCVSYVSPDGVWGRVMVPFHKPDAAQAEALRLSVSNAVRILRIQYEARCSEEASKRPLPEQAAAIATCKRVAEGLVNQSQPVRFSWEVPTSTEAGRITPVGNDGGPVCSCATYLGDAVPGPPCGGGCGNCWLCR